MALYIGVMSGTSLDGVDCALFDINDQQTTLMASHSLTYPQWMKEEVQRLALGEPFAIGRIGEIECELAELYAVAVIQLLQIAKCKAADVAALGCHGQTVWHQPAGRLTFSTQLCNPSLLAAKTGIVTVADFRQMDMAYGGQGAPFAPAFHAAVFSHPSEKRGILNIGGIANITLVAPGQSVMGFDTGPGNMLMDAWINEIYNKDYDVDGQWARSGKVHPELLKVLLADSYFSSKPPKSTGREKFNLDWLKGTLSQSGISLKPKDIQATLCELTAQSISDAIDHYLPVKLDAIYLCGGGAHNTYLAERISTLKPGVKINSTAVLGIHPQWVEAGIMAWYAKQRVKHQAIDLRHITGSSRPVILGGIYRPV